MATIAEREVFEQKRAEADFELVWAKLSQVPFASLKESYKHAYMQGRGVFKGSESQNVNNENEGSPIRPLVASGEG